MCPCNPETRHVCRHCRDRWNSWYPREWFGWKAEVLDAEERAA